VYYETFDEFVEGITDCLNCIETDYKSELATLMRPNFQSLKNVRLMEVESILPTEDESIQVISVRH